MVTLGLIRQLNTRIVGVAGAVEAKGFLTGVPPPANQKAYNLNNSADTALSIIHAVHIAYTHNEHTTINQQIRETISDPVVI